MSGFACCTDQATVHGLAFGTVTWAVGAVVLIEGEAGKAFIADQFTRRQCALTAVVRAS